MASIWDDLKKSVKDGLSVAAAKTEEYTRIGKAKLDLMNLNKNLSASFRDLGVRAFDMTTEAAKGDFSRDARVQELAGRIQKLQQDIRDKEKEIEEIRKGSASSSTASGAAETGPRDADDATGK
jgi:hypothetical protein